MERHPNKVISNWGTSCGPHCRSRRRPPQASKGPAARPPHALPRSEVHLMTHGPRLRLAAMPPALIDFDQLLDQADADASAMDCIGRPAQDEPVSIVADNAGD